GECVYMGTLCVKREAQIKTNLCEPTMIVQGLGEGLSLTQRHQNTFQLTSRKERRAQGEPEIDGLLTRGALLRQMPEGAERLLKIPHGLTVRRARQGLLSRLPAVGQGFVPDLPPQGMRSEPFDLLGQPVLSE